MKVQSSLLTMELSADDPSSLQARGGAVMGLAELVDVRELDCALMQCIQNSCSQAAALVRTETAMELR